MQSLLKVLCVSVGELGGELQSINSEAVVGPVGIDIVEADDCSGTVETRVVACKVNRMERKNFIAGDEYLFF